MVAGLLIIHSKSCFLLYLCYLFLFFFSFLSVYCYQPISLHPHAHMLSHVTPWTAACQAPLSMDFSRQEYWSRLPFPSPTPVFLHGEFRGQRSRAGYSPWGYMTEHVCMRVEGDGLVAINW